MNRSPFPAFAVSIGLAVLLQACSETSDPSSNAVQSSTLSVRGDTPLALSGRWLAFLADEETTGPGGTDLNGDGDLGDRVAQVVDMLTGSERSLGVAARDLVWVGSDLYLEVDPFEDGRVWGPHGTSLALLHWSPSFGLPAFVDALEPSSTLRFVVIEPPVNDGLSGAIVWVRPTPEGLGTNLRVARPDAPRTPLRVPARETGIALVLDMESEEQGLIFASGSELENQRDLNGDGDLLDTVLYLLDGAGSRSGDSYALPALSTRLAVRRLESSVLRAARRGTHEWLVAFLVSELDQGANLSGAADPLPPCAPDTDIADDVLAFVEFSDLASGPGAPSILSAGLPGMRRIEIADPYIATLVRELDYGACDLNGDGDVGDVVVAIVPAVPLPFPTGDAALRRAVADVPGGTHGLTSLQGRFVIVTDERSDQRDVDGDGQFTHNVVGWLDPRGALAWSFVQEFGVVLGASWMAPPGPGESVLSIAAEEAVFGSSINAPANGGVDLDLDDSFPAFAVFTGPGAGMRVTAAPFAVPPTNPGLQTARSVGFFRVLEAAEGRDVNGDGDVVDFMLRRSQVAGGPYSSQLSVLNDLPRPAIERDRSPTAPAIAFLADERLDGAEGTDLNGDGDAEDFVVSWLVL